MIKQLLKKALPENLTNFLLKLKNRKVIAEKEYLHKKKVEDFENQLLPLRKIFYSKFLKSNDLVFDVGANVGNRTAPMLQLGTQIIAIEPQKECYTLLEKKFGNKIRIVTKGLSDKEEIRDFYISNASTISSFASDWIKSVKEDRFKGYKWDKVVKVQMTTLDNLIKEFGLPVFIKIDVEGFELAVLKGISKSIPMISFEYTVPEQLEIAEKCLLHLKSINNNLECNYSKGESMEWGNKDWININEMTRFIHSSEFISTSFGDIYVKEKSFQF